MPQSKKEVLIVSDPKLASTINKKLSIDICNEAGVPELFRGIRSQMENLISGIPKPDFDAMVLGLSHSLSRYKLKFSPDKVDTMIVQAIALLDDLDKELNTYSMRVKEWYGWHFPEIGKIIVDNVAYAKTIKKLGFRTNASTTDLSDILPEELEAELKEAAEISMGTEISDEDMFHISALCDQIISLSDYRTQLYEYLKHRMHAIAPNLTAVVGELVGARLIAHAGSLVNLAKQPASTVQILGAEKALFRALKTKHDTPKYGLIYHASLIGQAGTKLKGKIARMVATKAALSCRLDSFGENEDGTATMGVEARAKLEAQLKTLEGRGEKKGGYANKPQQKKFNYKKDTPGYNASSDFSGVTKMDITTEPSTGLKRPKDEEEEETTTKPGKKVKLAAEAEEKKKKKKSDKEEKSDKTAEKAAEKAEKAEKKKKKSAEDDTKGEDKSDQVKSEKVKNDKVKSDKVKSEKKEKKEKKK